MQADAYEGATCLHCGSAWFTFAPLEEDEGSLVGICLDADGAISGWTGRIVCLECEEPWQRRPELKLVT